MMALRSVCLHKSNEIVFLRITYFNSIGIPTHFKVISQKTKITRWSFQEEFFHQTTGIPNASLNTLRRLTLQLTGQTVKCCGLLRQLQMLYICVRISPATGKIPAQRACNAENVSIWWRHHVIPWGWLGFFCKVYIHVAETKKALIVVIIPIVIIVIVYAGVYCKMPCFVCTLVKPGVFWCTN